MKRIRNLSTAAAGLALASAAFAQPASDRNAVALPQQNCLLKILSICKNDGSCARVDNLRGEKLPVKVTVDFDVGIIAGVGPEGWVDATRIASVAHTPNQLILQGVDNTIAWQLLIQQNSEAMSLSLAASDGASIGFGDCTAAKEQ